jgi:multiple antibiotic resistance protein
MPTPEFLNHWLYEFMTLLVILDPIATVPLFMAATAGLSRPQATRVGFYALGVAFLILLFFIVMGQHLLQALKIPMASFQLAGSLVFLMLGLQMATGRMHAGSATTSGADSLLSRAIYPLATPGIAGGGGILTVVMLTDNNTRSVEEQAITVGVLLSCLAVHFVSFLLAGTLMRVIGTAGIEVISRVFGLILTSIAVNGMVTAIQLSFRLGA